MSAREPTETILIVDDEPGVRETFRRWLVDANLGCAILTASDAETALKIASTTPIDLAILDWNLGAGNDGLQLLEDLMLWCPNVVAIMITGYAHQATPLAAMRMGVRDYLDKNQDLNHATFLNVVRKQLDLVRPAKRERRIHEGLQAFRSAVEKVLGIVQNTAALQAPLSPPAAISSLFRFLIRTTGARDGALLARSYDASRVPPEICRAFDAAGNPLDVPLVPFARSIAGSVVGLEEPSALERPDQVAAGGSLELQPFEKGRRSLLAARLSFAPGLQVVVELFDKQGRDGIVPFNDADRQLARAVADFGSDILAQALAEHHTHRVLFDAVRAALEFGDQLAQSMGPARPAPPAPPEGPPPDAVLQQLRVSLPTQTDEDAGATLRLAEAIRVLSLRYGQPALDHCTRLVEGLRGLLDDVTESGGGRP
jgi:ActR/RegA family two-component response regulator